MGILILLIEKLMLLNCANAIIDNKIKNKKEAEKIA